MKTIVVGYDASEAAERALDRAAELAEALSARLVVLSVATPPLPPAAPALEPAGPMPVPGGAALFSEPEPDPQKVAQQWLAHARSRLASRSVEADYVGEVGSPADELLAVGDEREAELIVVGSGDHGLLERLVAPPVEEAVARRADRDVLIVH
jgi:nucleotide-binding universal stress UspA family protein